MCIRDSFRRFLVGVSSAREVLRTGLLGPVIRVDASEGGRWEWGATSRYFIDDPAGGVIFDTGSHLLDSVLYILSLDTPNQPLRHEIHFLSKNPTEEPSHEIRARILLRPADLDQIELRLHVSRRQALANVIRVTCERGTLDVVHSPRDVCMLRINGTRLSVNQMIMQPPLDAKGCLALEYDDFTRSCRDRNFSSRLDSQRFVALSGLLDSLARAPASQFVTET